MSLSLIVKIDLSQIHTDPGESPMDEPWRTSLGLVDGDSSPGEDCPEDPVRRIPDISFLWSFLLTPQLPGFSPFPWLLGPSPDLCL